MFKAFDPFVILPRFEERDEAVACLSEGQKMSAESGVISKDLIFLDHTLYRALVLLKQSPWLLGTILYGSPLQHSIPVCWHSFCQPRKDDRPT